MISVRANHISLKYLRSMSLGCKDIGIRKFKFVAMTEFLYFLHWSMIFEPSWQTQSQELVRVNLNRNMFSIKFGTIIYFINSTPNSKSNILIWTIFKNKIWQQPYKCFAKIALMIIEKFISMYLKKKNILNSLTNSQRKQKIRKFLLSIYLYI